VLHGGSRDGSSPKKLDQSSLIKLVITKSQTAANRELGWFLAAKRTRSGSGELASDHKCLRIRDLWKEFGIFVRTRILLLGTGAAS
jgi:hypothetical protein